MKLLEACFCLSVAALVDANHRGGSTVKSTRITRPDSQGKPRHPTLHCCEAQNCEVCDFSNANGADADISDCFEQFHYASMRLSYSISGSGSCYNAIE